jgi:transcriptional regulator with XRE-family HTH domain|tara:strand:- start:193 stop:783 length:591 start_codon:yes stop_codon:yes gene_type:complete
MKLGTKIKELRKKEGLTQVDLSEKSGLSLRTIQRIENDENKPSVYSLRMIGEVLNYKFNLKKFNIMRNIFEKENRNYLILIFGLISVSIGGYFYYSNQLDNYVDVVDIKIESDKIEDFVNFEWDSMKEVVSLDSDKEIVVRLIYSNKDSISTGINNFDLKHKLTEINFEKDVKGIKRSLQILTPPPSPPSPPSPKS